MILPNGIHCLHIFLNLFCHTQNPSFEIALFVVYPDQKPESHYTMTIPEKFFAYLHIEENIHPDEPLI
jgi:hypothetical protein